jgi:hypothetical protein
VSSKVDRLLETHPVWCNVPHKPGSARSRQHHNRIWRSTNPKKWRNWRAEIYPGSPCPTDPRGSISIRMSDNAGGWYWWWPDLPDARAFAESLLELVDLAERGQA